MKRTILLLWLFVAVATALEFLSYQSSLVALRVAQSIIAIITVFIVPGICIAHIVHAKKKVPLTTWEYINIASASSLIIVPLLLLGENILFGELYTWLPFLNAILLLATACYFGYKKQVPSLYEIIQPLWIIAFGFFGLIIMLISWAYSALPESDPYYWLQQYRLVIPTGIFYDQDRPFFYALSYLFVGASHIDLYSYLKYIFPFLSILTLVPAVLVAKQYKSYAMRFVVLSVPFFAPSTFLYSQIPFPQAISITLMYYFFFWLIYSIGKKDFLFYGAAGLLSLLSYFYHETGIVPCLAWALVTITHYRTHIYEYIRKNKLVAILVILLVLNSPFIIRIVTFISYWAKQIIQNLHTINFRFPAEYTNIDGNSVGWGSIHGVAKYYFYYVGPVLLLATICFLYLLMINMRYRSFIKTKITNHPEIQIISIVAVLFFTVSEILPRIGGLAILPERMWTVGSIFASILVVSLFEFNQKKHLIRHTSILLLLVCVSIGAIVYVNSLKKYVIPEYQIKSTVWIKNNLPHDREILTDKYGTLINIHSESQAVIIKNSYYCDPLVQDARVLIQQLKQEHDYSRKNIYVYYSKDDVRNPYLSRPYAKEIITCDTPSFASYPSQYTEVYNDNNNVIIWKVK